ncbi:TonB-dependent siderophore receptor [Photobacterium gaetbulicola]|uniref:Putative ferrichrome-iron receptor n=1 Tax=Photobacterium gaetbulicola Gung47 TaxID=658445 RepID=A0A0C5WSC5_9GAMM|nr:TonB-dependent siderophore receptor [Photobacterium gaetbulicola]AJR05915.1 putative ferrichrome-iron receptor [Photobacterium gaetbulicola Gung47]PSU13272.1 TonB-dependent siderophore receptor [Photobacterium gaetbulicola]
MFNKSQLTLLIGAILAAPTAYAQEHIATTDVDEHMVVTARDYGYKADTSTTAMRIEASQLETAGQVSVIDEQLIDEQRASSLDEVLENDSSVSIGDKTRNRVTYSLRGFELQSGSGFLRDGKQHWSHYRQPIELLERVEVVKGPSGLLYGKSAPGGLINMVSKKPTYETQVNVSQDIGSDNESRTVVDVSGVLNEAQTLRARTVVSQQTYDNWRTYTDGSTPSTERFVGGLFVDYDVNDNVTVSVHYDKTRDKGGVDSGAYVKNGEVVLGENHIWDAQWSEIENNVENYGFDISAQLTNVWRMSASYNHQNFLRHDTESFSKPETYNPETGTFEYQGYDRLDDWQFDTAYLDVVGEFSALGVDHQLLVGSNWLGYYYLGKTDSIKGLTAEVGKPLEKPDGLSYKNAGPKTPTERDSYGFYIQDMITFNDQWQALAGLRYDREETKGSDLVDDALTPKVAVIYHPHSNGSIYASYSESFEPQGEVISGKGKEYRNDGEHLKPRKGKQYELGTKWELFDERLFVTGALFDIALEDVALDIQHSDGTYTKTQGGEQVHRGAELALQGYLTDRLSLHGNAMYLDAEYKSHADYQGKRPADVPEFGATIWSRYAFENNTNVNLGVTYVGERYGDDANSFKKDAYTRIDMGVSHTIHYDQDLDFIARFNVENVFDTDYMMGGDNTNVTLGEGRNFIATLQVRY